MYCPKCKNHIEDNVLRCPHCGLKVRIICPKCKTVNLMGKKNCEKCGFEFFIECQNCKTINLSTQQNCRKCSKPLTKNKAEIKKEQELQVQKVEVIQNVVEEKVVEAVPNVNRNIQISQPQNVIEQEQKVVDSATIKQEIEVDNENEGFIESSDNIEANEAQIQTLIEKVEEIEKKQEKKKDAELYIQQKFEQQEEDAQEAVEELPPEYVQLNQSESQVAIVQAIQNPLKKIISLNGKEGTGKTLILKYVYDELKKENYVWAWGECNALTQITAFGYIQDVLLNLFNLSNFSVNIEEFCKNNIKAISAQFFNLNQQEVNDLVNFLYPTKCAHFDGILKRKEYTINLLKKVFEIFTQKSTVIFVADDFENIDGSSFEFLKSVIDDEKLSDKIKILLTNKYNKIAQGYFYSKKLIPNNFANIFLSSLNEEQSDSLIETLFGTKVKLPIPIEKQLYENSKGISAYIEQVCLLLNEIGAIKFREDGNVIFDEQFSEYLLPYNSYKIIEERLRFIESQHPVVVEALYVASLLGNKFSVHQFENVLKFNNDEFKQICGYLINANYLIMMSDNYFSFKNTMIWHYVYERAKTAENYDVLNEKIYSSVTNMTLSNNSLLPLLLQNTNNKKAAFDAWTKASELASYLGDTNLYVISNKQQLKLADEVNGIIMPEERIKIFERLGKLLYKISPKEAVNYLSSAIAYYKEPQTQNSIKVIELSAFLTQACNKTADYLGIIETCETALSVLDDETYSIEKALITTKKLSAVLNLGNCEEVINIINTDLLDIIEDALAKPDSTKAISNDMIFDIWVETLITLASAYALQGNPKAFETLERINDALLVNKVENENHKMKILITKALAYAVRGESKYSADVLSEITSKYPADDMEQTYILKWNFINIINKVVSKDYQNIIDEMFQVTTFADNLGDVYTKNFLKFMLGYIIQNKSKNLSKALEIYNEEILFFSKEKIAIGALLCWSMISNASLVTKGVDFALDIAMKALDVAKNPKINNYIFIIALKWIIAEIYMIKNDYDAVKMYLEKALSLAKKYDLRYFMILLYKSLGKYNEEMTLVDKESQQEYALKAVGMYKIALKYAQKLALQTYESSISKDISTFKVSCQLNNIQVAFED